MSRRLFITLALAGLSLQVVVPPGFMPASVDDGWHLKWCPDGMSTELMHALFGHAHHHADESVPYKQCDLSGLSADNDIPDAAATLTGGPDAQVLLPVPGPRHTSTAYTAYRPRAPPAPTAA